ncbi:MAG: monovalent cation/H+ antiporter complex subunit F [Lachnospiraceae bacterium]|nr:monovalent cation/H+ antiporter complex subunit F [Lachnospiraceae bacterium]
MFSSIDYSLVPGLETFSNVFMSAVIVIIAVFAVLCLIRAIVGPRVSDRVVATNMIGTLVICVIAVLSVTMESYLADVCLVYAAVSFLAVIVLTKLYTGVYRQNEDGETDFYGQIEIDKYEQASIDRMVKEADEDEEDEDDAPIENEFKGAKSTR